MKRNKTAVIGLGNRLLADEGAGLHAIDLLRERLKDSDVAVDLVEAGTPGMGLLHHFQERDKILFLDAGNCGKDVGQYRRFLPEEAVSKKETKKQSLHDFDLMKFIEFAKSVNFGNRGTESDGGDVEVVVYCMQAAEMKMSEQLSPVVAENLPSMVDAVYDEIMGQC